MKINYFEIMYFFVDKEKIENDKKKKRLYLIFIDLNCKVSVEFKKEV